MSLSHDIISEFVKVTNGNKEKPKEGIVYATIVQASDGKYVKIDGSDLLTPTDTTTDIEDGERVTVMIKDHKATVTGNVTAPSASGNRVDKVVEVVSDQLGVFETVVADKVSTNELEAYKATIEHLIAGKAEIEDLEATNAEIENLKVKNAEIENAVIDKATIEDLEAVNAEIENLKVKNAEIENAVIDKATIEDLEAVNADIQNLKAQHAHIEDLVADKADIEDLEAVNATIENLKVKDAEIENAVVDNLEATKAEIGILNADFAEIKTLVSGNLTSDNILSFNITADKVTMEDAFIKDAMIDTVNAAKINAGRINTNSVVIGSEDGGMRISGATQQFTDKNGNVRIQIGRDASNDFTFALYGEDGQGQIINQNGITASAIADGLIVNDMVSDNAAISGGKLDISSVVTEINNDNTTTIKSNKIYLDEQNQSLEVAFKSLKTQVDTIKDIDSDLTTITDKIQSNTSKIEANKSSISTLLAEDAAIKKQVTDLEGNVVETTNTLTSKYTSLQQNLDGFKTTVNNTYATKTSVNDVKNNLSSNYSTTSAMNSAINQKVDEITASVSSTYATKNEVKTIDDNIKANYSTTEQMESAISVAKNEINLGISQVYETKSSVTSQVSTALTSAKSYADTKKSEAISTASSDATSKANNALTSAKSYADTKKSEAITSANNTLNNTIANYYTKAQTDSQIKVAKDAIDLSVKNTYETKSNVQTQINNIQVGGTNLVRNSDFSNGTNNWSTVSPWGVHPTTTYGEKKVVYISRSGLTSDSWAELKSNGIACKQGEIYTMSVDVKTSGLIANTDTATLFIWSYDTNGGNRKDVGSYVLPTSTDWVRYKFTGTIPSGSAIVRACITIKRNGTIYATNFKLEKGNKATDWSPAPEDINTDITTKTNNALNSAKSYADTKKTEAINSANSTLNTTIANYYTKAQTDSQIKIAKDSINLGVSETYETKTNVTSKVNSAISTASSDATSKANNALTSAKSYADTKKSEAITSANNTLNSTIANYYTKAQTDSQIKIAKDSITSSVSSTYETKTNVQNKIDAIQVGGRNLAIGSKTATNDLASGGGTVTTASDLFGGVTAVKTNTAWSGRYFNLKAIAQRGGFKVGDKLVLSVYIKSDQNVTLNVTAHRTMGTGNTAGSSKAYNNFTVTPTWKQVWFPFVADAGTLDRVDARIEVNTATNTNYIYWAGWKLEKGTVGTDWSPAPEDVDNTISSLSTRVSTAEQKITDSAIVSTVTSSTTYKNNLTGKVDKTTIISSINQTAESVKINASKIELTGTVVANAINNGSTTINGSKITTGSITADKIAVGDFTNYAQLNDNTASLYGFTKGADEVNGAWLTRNSMARDIAISDIHTCNGGETFRVKADISTTIKGNTASGGTDSTYRGTAISIFVYDGTGKTITWLFGTRVSNATQSVSSTITLPTTARKFRVYIHTESYGNWSGTLKVRNIQVTRMTSGELIVNGAITANMITSGTFQGTNFIAGGSSNGNGYFQVKDSSNDVKFHASKNGVYATTMTFPNTISVSGAITQSGNVYANSNGFNVNGEETGTLYRTVYTSQVGLSGITTTEQSYDTSNGGNVAGTKYTTKITGYAVNINGSSLRHGGSGSLEVGTSYGMVRIGPVNSDWCHFQTDRGKFHFQKAVYVSGEIYAGSGYNQRVYHTGYKPTPADIGAAKALVSANGYQGMTLNDGSTSNWIRTTTNGLLPSASSGSSWPSSSSSLGTSSWRFSKGYVKEMHVNGLTNDLGDIWLTAKAGANTIYAQAKWLCPATSATTYLGSSGYRWHSVWAANGTIQTSDERFKIKRGFVNIDDCFEMIKNTDIYNYIMLNENKEKLSKNRLGKMAMENSKNDVNTHIGIMAQDIQKYECSKGILIENEYEKEDGTVDTLLGVNAYGLATAVMGGLKKEIQIRDEQYECLKRENEELKTRLANIERMLMQTLD